MNRFAAQMTRNAAKVPARPNATVAAIDPIIPARNIRRPPTRSTTTPFAVLPPAYASTPAELTTPSAVLSKPRGWNSASSCGATTARFERQT